MDSFSMGRRTCGGYAEHFLPPGLLSVHDRARPNCTLPVRLGPWSDISRSSRRRHSFRRRPDGHTGLPPCPRPWHDLVRDNLDDTLNVGLNRPGLGEHNPLARLGCRAKIHVSVPTLPFFSRRSHWIVLRREASYRGRSLVTGLSSFRVRIFFWWGGGVRSWSAFLSKVPGYYTHVENVDHTIIVQVSCRVVPWISNALLQATCYPAHV